MIKNVCVHREGQTITIWSDDKDMTDRIMDAVDMILDAERWRVYLWNEKKGKI